MYYVITVLLFLLIFYLGEIIGLKKQCENCKQLRTVRRLVWYIPFIQIIMLVSIIEKCIKNRNAKLLIAFFTIGESSLIILGCCSAHVSSQPVKNKKVKKEYCPLLLKTADSAVTAIGAYV